MVEGISNISGIGNNISFTLGERTRGTAESEELSFSRLLQDNLSRVNELNHKSDRLAEDFALGKIDNIHEVTIAAEKAQTALNLTSAVQNQVIGAYEEIMRMQV